MISDKTPLEKYTAATQTLLALGYDLSSIYLQRKEKDHAGTVGQPSELTKLYPHITPSSWSAHFENGPPLLTNSTIREGGQFVLTSQQRSFLLHRFGLTPTRTVTVNNMAFFPPETHESTLIHSFTINSNLHVADYKLRRHMLVAVRITDAGEFFQLAREQQETDTDTEKPSKSNRFSEYFE